MEYDGSDEYENLTPAMVTSVMLLNDIPHVWHRLVANLEIKWCQASSTYKALHDPWSHIIFGL